MTMILEKLVLANFDTHVRHIMLNLWSAYYATEVA
jgi:hypothetical protein